MQRSTLEAYLQHKRLLGKSVPTEAPVKRVLKRGDFRYIRYADGVEERVTKRQLLNRFNSTLQHTQAKLSIKSIKRCEDGTATVLIGGKKKGEVKKYASPRHALLAVRRSYPLAKVTNVKTARQINRRALR